MVHKMKTLEEVLYDYTRGEKTLEEANKALKELGCGLTLDPTRNLFSARELLETRAGETPDEANGWGILDHGVGERPHGGRGHGPGDRLCLYGRKAIPPAGRCADGGGLRWSC